MFFIRSYLDEGFLRLYVFSVERGFCFVFELFLLLLMLGRGFEGIYSFEKFLFRWFFIKNIYVFNNYFLDNNLFLIVIWIMIFF